MPAGLVDRVEALEAYGRLWRNGPERVLLVWGEPGSGVSTVLRYLWRGEKRRRAILDMDRIPLRPDLIVQALSGQLSPGMTTRRALAESTQEMIAGRRAEIIASPIVAVSLGGDTLDPVAVLGERLTGDAVIFFDGCDRLAAEPEFLRWFDGYLLRQLAACVPGLRVVLGGDPGQLGRLASERVWLRPWEPEESIGFLRANGLSNDTEAAELARVVGGHPFVLSLIAEEHAATGGRVPGPGGDAKGAWLFGRLLDPLPDLVRALAEMALSLRWFSLQRLQALRAAEVRAGDYRRLLSLPWIQQDTDSRWRAHPALRFLYARWCLREQPAHWAELHQAALGLASCGPVDRL